MDKWYCGRRAVRKGDAGLRIEVGRHLYEVAG